LAGARREAAMTPAAKTLLAARGVRAFGDGFVALLLPVHLTRLGFDALAVGLLTTAALLGSAALTLAIGVTAHRADPRRLLGRAARLMLATGLALARLDAFWPLLLVAAVGTVNPSGGDSQLFVPLEHALLAHAGPDSGRTTLFARYSLVGALAGAGGALAAAAPDLAERALGVGLDEAMRAMFAAYGVAGIVAFALYRRLPPRAPEADGAAAPLGKSRRVVFALAALFSVDSFGGGFFVQSLLALWLFERFDLSLAAAAGFFFWSGVLAAFSFPVAARLAARFGLVNTMVFTHIPSSLCVMLVPFAPSLGVALALLLVRAALSQMDVPTRSSYVMAIVTPPERAAAASFTAVPRSLAASLSPALAGWMMAAGAFAWPLLIGGALKIAYDLALLAMFRRVRPPEEAGR
jgi:MFS family permease